MKKALWALAFILLTGISFCLFYQFPNLIFDAEENLIWNIARNILLSLMISGIVCGCIAACLVRNKLLPYLLKLLKFRTLLFQLVRRDFLAKYKRSVLGVIWSLLNPLLTMLVMTIIFSTLFRFDIDNYPVYILSGQIIFTMFSEITNSSMSSILSSANLIKKVNVPKYIFPLSKSLSSLVNFAFSLIALFLVMAITGSPISANILFIPIPIILIFVFSTGIGMILSSAVVFFRDINYLYSIFLTIVTYLTPLFYPISIVPDQIKWIISMNPLYHFVEYFRTVVIYGGLPTLWQNAVCILLALFSFGLGLTIFYRKQDEFILHI